MATSAMANQDCNNNGEALMTRNIKITNILGVATAKGR